MPGPERLIPDAVKRFDLMIPFAFINRREHDFDAAEQTQAHDLPDDARMAMSTAKAIFIVELLNLRQP